MQTLGIITIIYVIGIIISIAFAVRFWMTMTRIKDIRDILYKQYKKRDTEVLSQDSEKQNSENGDYSVGGIFNVEQADVDALISKLKPEQCVVFVNKTQKLEIWNKSDWDDVVRLGKSDFFKLLHKNF